MNTRLDQWNSTQLTLSPEDHAELLVSMFHLFKAGIVDAISRFK